MDLEKIEFLPDDFEFVGDKQDITKDVVAPSLPAWKDSLNRFKKNKGAVIGLICILVIAVFAIFAPMFSSYKFDAINTRIASISPGAEHFFGTDTMVVIYLYVFGQVQDIHYSLPLLQSSLT